MMFLESVLANHNRVLVSGSRGHAVETGDSSNRRARLGAQVWDGRKQLGRRVQ